MKNLQFTFVVPAKLAYGVACVLAGGLLFTAAGALADGSAASQTVLGTDLIMPYDGYLMVDATPITGVRTIRFDLYQDATGGVVKWTETQTVNLYNGRFSVGLGSATSLTSTILDAEKLYLAMTVVDTDSQGNTVEIELSGRQAIEPAPFAAWAGNSADMNVANILTVGSSASIGGAATVGGSLGVNGGDLSVSAGNLTVSGTGSFTQNLSTNAVLTVGGQSNLGNGYSADRTYITGVDNSGTNAALVIDSASDGSQMMYIDGNEIDSNDTLHLQNNLTGDVSIHTDLDQGGMLKFGYSSWDGNDTGDGGAAIANDNGSYEALMIVGNDSAGGRRVVKMYDDVIVDDDFQAKGNVTLGNSTSDTTTVKGDLTVNGDLKSWPQGNYCILISSNDSGCSAQTGTGCDCPSGFSFSSIRFDVDNSFVTSGNPRVSVVDYSSPNDHMGLGMCCK